MTEQLDSGVPVHPDRPVRVRIAPSPTGDPHVGTAYIALFNLAFARKHGGRFVLRIEDTDRVRSTEDSEASIVRSLKWVGLEWDEGPDVGGDYGPYRQSERAAIYQEHAQLLIDRGEAYYCFATADELAEMRRVQKEQKLALGYDRRYRDLDAADVRRRLDEGQPYVIRLKMPVDGETVVTDALRGEISFDNKQIDDQILMKSDGFPTYHLANVVDDYLMGISHVIRAEEWIPSTPKHVRLYEAFGWEAPVWVHMPLLRNDDKSKISKRKNSVSLDYYREAGILPEALLNFLGRMGWSMPDEAEKFTLDAMIEAFTFERVSLAGPVFNVDKLAWLNGLYLRELETDAFVQRLRDWLLDDGYLSEIAPLLQERVGTLADFVPASTYFFSALVDVPTELLIPKGGDKKSAYRAMKATVEAVDTIRSWKHEAVEATLREQCAALEWKPRDYFMMLRYAITGRKATPPLFDTMEVIGKSRCQARLRAALLQLRP